MSKVYVKTDSENRIIEINSDIFLFNMSEYTLIDEGDGDKYYHAQSHYLLNGLIDSHGCYNYKLVDGEVAERTLGEKGARINYNSKRRQDRQIKKEPLQHGLCRDKDCGGCGNRRRICGSYCTTAGMARRNQPTRK